jgi:hypothetical protein
MKGKIFKKVLKKVGIVPEKKGKDNFKFETLFSI